MIQFLNKPSLTLLLGIIFLSLVLFTGCEQDPLPTQSSTAGDRSVEKSLSKSLSMNDRTSGRFIVTFKGRPDHAVVQEAGGSVVYSYNIIPAMAVKGPQEFITNLAANPSVLRIEPDKKVFALGAELDNTWGVKRIGSGAVHAGGNSGNGVRVGILDSGIDYLHEDLNDNYVGGVDFVNNDDEESVKNWLAEQLLLRARYRYHVHLEAEVANKDKPDIILSGFGMLVKGKVYLKESACKGGRGMLKCTY